MPPLTPTTAPLMAAWPCPLALVSCASLLASLWALVCGVAFPRLGGFRNLPRPAGRVHSARSSRSFISLLRGVLCRHRSLGVTLSTPWPRGLFGPFGSPYRLRPRPSCFAPAPPAVRAACSAWSGRAVASGGPARAVALVGLLRGPLPPRQRARPRPSYVGAGALASLGTAVSLRGFFSASAVFCDRCPAGFPLSRRLARFAPSVPRPNARVDHTFFDHRGAMGFAVVVLGASHLRPSRGLASSPRTPGAPTRGAFFRGCSLPHPRAPWLVFFMVVMLTPVRGLIPLSACLNVKSLKSS